MAYSRSLQTSKDLISNMPEIVTDKILRNLPLSVAAKTSILSRTWKRNWLSCHYIIFDHDFWKDFYKDAVYDLWPKGSSIISNILFHHSGRIYSFHLELRPPGLLVEKNASLSQWLSLLSRTCPKKITLINWASGWSHLVVMPSYIFHCTELTKLKLQCFVLNAPPIDVKAFPHLRALELYSIKFNNGIDMLWSFIAKCPCLVLLRLSNCLDMDILEIEAPRLEKLIIKGSFDSLRLKNVPRLVDVSLWSTKLKMNGLQTVVASINNLVNSSELQCLAIEGNLCKFLAAGGINKSLPLTFNHLDRLRLTDVTLSESDAFCFTLGMVQSCPFIKDLEISIISVRNAVQPKYEYCSDKYKLSRLHKAKITGITGTTADLKLIEYVLSISGILDKLFFKCAALDAATELKVTRQLIRLPRASTKAQVVCLEE